MGIDTEAVLKAAGSKWNFIEFQPGLVGGHCIGVDPYYLTFKAQAIGYNPEIVLAGRRLNDGMGEYVASQLMDTMKKNSIQILDARILVMGLTFKEDCPDLRNTRVIDMVENLQNNGCIVDVHDPWVNSKSAMQEYGIPMIEQPQFGSYDSIVLAVAHKQFIEMGSSQIRRFGKDNHILYDL